MGRLEGKVAIITGGASGIGRETAILFVREGAKVLITDVNEIGCQETISMVDNSENIRYIVADVSKEEDSKRSCDLAVDCFGKLDIMFNNAGIMHPDDGGAEDTTERIWDLTMNINLKGVFFGCKYAIPHMRKNGGGSIINTASFVAFSASAASQIAYTSSKGGVVSFTQELAMIHARENIRANSICPGPIRTDLLMKFLDTDEKKNRRLVHLPMGRFAEAEEMAKSALFLASSDSSYVTGSNLMVDGGLCRCYITPE